MEQVKIDKLGTAVSVALAGISLMLGAAGQAIHFSFLATTGVNASFIFFGMAFFGAILTVRAQKIYAKLVKVYEFRVPGVQAAQKPALQP